MSRRYMNQIQYKDIMKEEGLKESNAVRSILKQAAIHANIVRKLKLHAEAHPYLVDKFQNYIKEYDEKRVSAVWQAISVACEEKRQGWRFVEDGASFLAHLEVKYDGDLNKATEVEKLQIQLTTLYDQLYRKAERGEMW